MTPSLALVALCSVLIASGTYLLTSRSVVRAILGVILLGNGANLLLVTAGSAPGAPPIVGSAPPQEMTDPLPQAMALTAIVIGLGLAAFLLALAHRLWQLTGTDTLADDTDDAAVKAQARAWSAEDADDAPGVDTTPDDIDDQERRPA